MLVTSATTVRDDGGYLTAGDALKGREQLRNEARIIPTARHGDRGDYTPPANGPHGTGLPTEVPGADRVGSSDHALVNRIAYTVKGVDREHRRQ